MTPEEAVAEQLRLAPSVVRRAPEGFAPRVAAGLDVAYDGDRLVAAVACVDVETGERLASAVVEGRTTFPYVPGLFAYRELPALRDALAALPASPDVLLCDGHGVAHPRRFGLASHLGVTTGIPAVGVAKNPLGDYSPPARERGSWTPLTLDADEVGRALRTQHDVKPVFVSVGHLIDIDTATDLVLRLARHHRQPETTRAADHLCRMALASLRTPGPRSRPAGG
jgi:deoxyribonuclease V